MTDTSVKVAVRIRPLNSSEQEKDNIHCLKAVDDQIVGGDAVFTFDHTFSHDCEQSSLFEVCVVDLVNAAFEGFNATILAYGQTVRFAFYVFIHSSDIKNSGKWENMDNGFFQRSSNHRRNKGDHPQSDSNAV